MARKTNFADTYEIIGTDELRELRFRAKVNVATGKPESPPQSQWKPLFNLFVFFLLPLALMCWLSVRYGR